MPDRCVIIGDASHTKWEVCLRLLRKGLRSESLYRLITDGKAPGHGFPDSDLALTLGIA